MTQPIQPSPSFQPNPSFQPAQPLRPNPSTQPTRPLRPAQPNPSTQLNPSTQPTPPLQSTPRAPIPESVTCRLPLIGRIAVIVLAVAGVIMIGLGIGLAVSGEMTGFAVCTVMGLILVAILPFGLRPRVILDARGIHVRNIASSHDLPWPASRGALVVGEVSNGNGWLFTATPEYRPSDGSKPVKMLSLRRVRPGIGNATAVLEADLDDLWAWAVARGYVRPENQAAGAPAPGYGTGGNYGNVAGYANAAGYGTAPGYGIGDYGSAPAPSAPLGAGVPRGASAAADLDVDMLSRPQLEFKGPGALAVCLFAGFGLFMIVGSAFALQNDGSFWGVPGIAFGAFLLVLSVDQALKRVTIDQEGFHVRGLIPRTYAWPASRAQLVATFHYSRSSSYADASLVEPDGKRRELPLGVLNRNGGLGPELGMVRTLDTIWAWGERRGVARETGQYVPAANAAFEQSRRSALERIDYLRSGR